MVSASHRLAAAFAATALIAGLASAARAAPVTVTCSPTKMRVMASNADGILNTKNEFKTIPQAVVSFTQGGTQASCVIVRFSAMTYSGVSGAVRVRVTIDDDDEVAVPPEVFYGVKSSDNMMQTQSYDFLFASVPPGAHIVRVQFRAPNGEVYVNKHTTVVRHAP